MAVIVEIERGSFWFSVHSCRKRDWSFTVSQARQGIMSYVEVKSAHM